MHAAPWLTQVEFSSQVGFKYDYGSRDTDDGGLPPLELAWAITVHKSQGSEFGTTFLVLPKAARHVSRELLYTALTRQTERIVLLYEASLDELLELTRTMRSEVASRLTDLFRPPNIQTLAPADGEQPIVVDDELDTPH